MIRTGTRTTRTVRAALAPVLLVLACLLVPLGTLSTWAKYEIGDSGRYVSTMAPLATDPGVQNAVGAAVTTGIMKNISVGPLQSTVEQYLHDAVVSFTDTPAFQNAWNTANRAAHDAVQQALDDGDTGAVTLDLAPVTKQVRQQLQDDGVPFAAQIPVTHTEITVLSAGDLAELRTVFHLLQVAGLWLPLASLVLTVAGLLLAVRRRRALVATALGMALGAAALLLALTIARSLTLGDLDSDADKAAAGAVYDALTSSMRTVSWVIIGVGAAVAVAAWLTGRYGFGLPGRRAPQEDAASPVQPRAECREAAPGRAFP
ncbi:hypothetical protein OKJ48_25110 [Streptomyces kunmingensis]|uniref:Integral membrane protein n=1 Tax=Streptomyces kunmingensis TaxID=68225 RepID=A0ABU6CFL3_9ACTN|nr:hypothetical protein [Streptomyces kunmingensis]MEB3963498.1 hypothetical protein [Streptomyces kunmingensis]